MAPSIMHVLFEHATGYALFRVKEFEDLAMLQAEFEASVQDLSRFNSIVKLVAFSPFLSQQIGEDNVKAVAEGVMHENLRTFLEANLPKTSKKSKSLLGVSDSKLATSIGEVFELSFVEYDVVREMTRGFRLHACKLIKGLQDAKAQLCMGLVYSRNQVKYNINKADNMVIQSSALADQMEKDVNTNSMRLGEWYSYHFPELKQIIKDNYMYARVAHVIGDRNTFDDAKEAQLEEIVMDSAKVKAIHDAARMSMGMDIGEVDLINVERFAKMVISLTEYRKELQQYVKNKMYEIAPNMSVLIGEQVGARLISQAGSLKNLAKYPASTVQILGAEKALFRALKTKGNTPKYGLIFHSTFIGRAGAKNKGRISRYLANKTSIAARIDFFTEENPTQIFGEHLKQQVEDRLKFYESGEAPAKNCDVMKLAFDEVCVARAKMVKDAKKKQKKRSSTAADESMETDAKAEVLDASNGKKKKRKHSEAAAPVVEEEPAVVADAEKNGKKKKKRKSEGAVEAEEEEEVVSNEPPKKKKKKSKIGDKTI